LSTGANAISKNFQQAVEKYLKAMLTYYAVDARYPDDEPIPCNNETRQAFNCAKPDRAHRRLLLPL
jgi:hypothetical protein